MPVIAVQHYLSAMSKRERPFTVFGFHFLCRPSNFWVLCDDLHTGADGLHGMPGRVRVLLCKEAIQALDILQRGSRPDQTWHLGASSSCPASSLASQSSASSSVKCNPEEWYSSHALMPACRKASRVSSRSTYCRIASRIIQWGVRWRASASLFNRSFVAWSILIVVE